MGEVDASSAAHAVATFSELGIGLSVAVLSDIAKWRVRVRGNDGDAIRRESLKAAARQIGWIYALAVNIADKLRFFLWYILPIISGMLGYLSLQALANNSTLYFGFFHIGINCYFCSVLSFWLSTATAVLMGVASTSVDKEMKLKNTKIAD